MDERHKKVHLKNKNINYILTENCPYCKLEKRINYRRRKIQNRIRNNVQIEVERHIPRPNFNLYLNFDSYIQSYHNSLTNMRRYVYNPNNNLINTTRRHINTNFNNRTINHYNNTYFNQVNPENLIDVEVLTEFRRINQNSKLILNKDETEFCSICQSSINCNEIVRILDCGHQYHCNCIDIWFESNKKCPLCNFELTI